MKIKKIKKYKNKYKLFIDDDLELLVYENVLIELNILKTRKIDTDFLNNIIYLNNFYEGYYNSIKLLLKNYSSFEIRKYLLDNYSNNVEKIYKKLLDNNLINDYNVSYNILNKYQDSKGYYFIKNKLEEKNIDNKIIDEVLKNFNSNNDYINKYIKKELINYKGSFKKNILRIKNNLFNKGFNQEDINKYLNNYQKDSKIELNNLKKDYLKYKNKNNLINYLYSKGYDLEDITKIIK